MDDDKEIQEDSKMSQTDPNEDTNLCCCCNLDQNDQNEDPCYLPVDECCC